MKRELSPAFAQAIGDLEAEFGVGLIDASRRWWTSDDAAELARLERWAHNPTTLDEFVAWQSEFGADERTESEVTAQLEGSVPKTPTERAARRREWLKGFAELFGVSYGVVKAAYGTACRDAHRRGQPVAELPHSETQGRHSTRP